MKQLTVRNLDHEVILTLEKMVRDEGLSLNQAALKLLRRGAGVDSAGKRPRIGNALDRFSGTVSAEDEREFYQSTGSTRTIDPEFWR